MQSETVDFTYGAATWRTGRNLRAVFDYGPFAPLSENMTSLLKKLSLTVVQVIKSYTVQEMPNLSLCHSWLLMSCCQSRNRPSDAKQPCAKA